MIQSGDMLHDASQLKAEHQITKISLFDVSAICAGSRAACEDICNQIDDIIDVDPAAAIGIPDRQWIGSWSASEYIRDQVNDIVNIDASAAVCITADGGRYDYAVRSGTDRRDPMTYRAFPQCSRMSLECYLLHIVTRLLARYYRVWLAMACTAEQITVSTRLSE